MAYKPRQTPTQPRVKAFGRRVADLRRERGLTQLELAHRSGLGQNVISEVETGRRDCRLSAALLLADGLDVRLAELAGDL